jgi:hypothetical protein
MKEKQIDFKFARGWKQLLKWYESIQLSGNKVSWEEQTKKIQFIFESTVPNIVNWKKLWSDFDNWYEQTCRKNKTIALSWNNQQRQVETLMLLQLRDLNKEIFVLVYLHKGKPHIDSNPMTYWDAVRVKQTLEGDRNGIGGDENIDKISIVNLNTLIQ